MSSQAALSLTFRKYVQQTFEQRADNALRVLEDDLTRLAYLGMVSIISKTQALASQKLLARVADEWTHYFTTVVPYVEACMLPLQTIAGRLEEALHSSTRRSKPPANLRARTAPQDTDSDDADTSSTASDDTYASDDDSIECPSQKPVFLGPLRPTTHQTEFRGVNARRILFMAFRDQLILPISDWLMTELPHVDGPPAQSSDTPAAPSEAPQQTELGRLYGRLRQMTHLLCSVHTNDSAQQAMERLRLALPAYQLHINQLQLTYAPVRTDLFAPHDEPLTSPTLSAPRSLATPDSVAPTRKIDPPPLSPRSTVAEQSLVQTRSVMS